MQSSDVKEEKTDPVVANNSQESEIVKSNKEENDNVSIKSEQQNETNKIDEPSKKDEDGDDVKKELDPLIQSFYSEIDEIKTEDFKTTSKEQLDRLLRPGSTYFNLNPFEVLQIDPYASVEDVKKKYRKLSMYVHPDKNNHDKERAQIAFEAVNRAYKLLSDEKERKQCLEVVDEARERVDAMCEEKRKKLRKEIASAQANAKSSKNSQKIDPKTLSDKIDEDDPDKYRHSIYVMTCKLFADLERLKVREMEKKAEEKKRKAEETATDEVKSKTKKEWDKNYEESRESRVSSWKDFKTKKAPSGGYTAPKAAGFRPPKHKPETR